VCVCVFRFYLTRHSHTLSELQKKTGTEPFLGQCEVASKPDVLFYSGWNLLPACGVQSVQRTEMNYTALLTGRSNTITYMY